MRDTHRHHHHPHRYEAVTLDEPTQIIERMYAKLAELEAVAKETEEQAGIRDEL